MCESYKSKDVPLTAAAMRIPEVLVHEIRFELQYENETESRQSRVI